MPCLHRTQITAAKRAARATPAPTPLDAAPAVTTGGRVAVVVPLLGTVTLGRMLVRVDRVAGVVTGTGGTTTPVVVGLMDDTTGGVATGVVWTGGGATGGVGVTIGTGWVSVTGHRVVEMATVTVVYCSPGQSGTSGAQDVMVWVEVAKMVE